MQQPPKFIYFGTPKVAGDTLELLVARGFVPEVVVTSPDASRGRGLILTPSETKACARTHGISVLVPEKLDAETGASLEAYGCDYAVVVAYGKIFPETLIAAFPKGVVNVHYSLLPKYRGATPLEAALLAGDSVTGVTVQKMVKELDAGDIIAQTATPIKEDETARELRPRLIELGATLLADTLPAYLAGDVLPKVQDASLASHTRKFTKEDGLLALDAPASVNWNKYRAYADSIGTYFFSAGGVSASGGEKRVKIVSAKLINDRFTPVRVIPEGKREMNFSDLARG